MMASVALAAPAGAETGRALPPTRSQPAANVSSPPAGPAHLIKDTRSTVGQNTLGLIGGPPGSTESQIAFEISRLIAGGQETGPNGELALRVLPSVGSGGVQNIRDLLTLPGVDMAIAPITLVDTIKDSGELGDISRKLTFVAALHVEEVHIIAGPQVQSLRDLDGKAVNVSGDEGAKEVVRNLLSALGVRVTWASVDHHAAAEQIKRGDLAATAVLSGKPVSSLSEYKREAGFHFLSVPYIDSLPSGYLPAKLSHADYTDLVEPSESVDTVAVGSGLFAYDWPARSARNRLLGEFVQAFFSKGAEWAHSIGHPKWQEINLAANLPGWRRQAVAERWLKREQSAQSDVAARQDFEQFLNATGSVTPERLDREELFREYLQWRKKNAATVPP